MAEYVVVRKASFRFWLVLGVCSVACFLATCVTIVALILDWERAMMVTLAFGVYSTSIAAAVSIDPEDAVKEFKKAVASETESKELKEKELLRRQKFLEKWHENLGKLKKTVDLKVSSSGSSPDLGNSPDTSLTTQAAIKIGTAVINSLPKDTIKVSEETIEMPRDDEE